MRTYTLGRSEMLKSRKTLETLFREGKNLSAPPVRLHFLLRKTPPSEGEKNVTLGVGAGKKYFRKAVHRNRIKRLLREAYRLQKLPLLGQAEEKNWQLSLFFQYTGRVLPSFEEIYQKVGELLQKLQHRLQ